RDMATHQVMGPDEELLAAQEVEKGEVGHWVALLSYVPVAKRILGRLRMHIESTPEEERPNMEPIEAVERSLAGLKLNKDGGLSAKQASEWYDVTFALATGLRLADSDRLWMADAFEVARIAEESEDDAELMAAAKGANYPAYLAAVKHTDAV